MRQGRKYRLKWFRLIMVGLIAYFAYLSFGQQAQLKLINQEAGKVQNQLEEAQQLNTKLNEERSRLHDRAYVEKIAREELGLVKPGEVPYVPAKEQQ